jgi:hypothetical protein
MRQLLVVGVLVLAGCGEHKHEAAPPRPSAIDAAPAAVAAPDAAPVATGECVADANHCCLPDGTLVVPGGCQPSYPDNVRSATDRNPDGSCQDIPCYLKCLPATAKIATPRGEIAVDQLAVGDPVWTVDARGARVEARVLEMHSQPVTAHEIVEITLADGRVVRASGEHPLAGPGSVGGLVTGDPLDGSRVAAVRALPYDGTVTWDLLPDGATGVYWADGVLLGSTLAQRVRAR